MGTVLIFEEYQGLFSAELPYLQIIEFHFLPAIDIKDKLLYTTYDNEWKKPDGLPRGNSENRTDQRQGGYQYVVS